MLIDKLIKTSEKVLAKSKTKQKETAAYRLESDNNCPECNNSMEQATGATGLPLNICINCRIALPGVNKEE